jgi:hypothetical protein
VQISLQRYALSLVFYASYTDGFHTQTMMFLILKGYAELVSLPLQLEFTSLLFSGESLRFFNHTGNFKA